MWSVFGDRIEESLLEAVRLYLGLSLVLKKQDKKVICYKVGLSRRHFESGIEKRGVKWSEKGPLALVRRYNPFC